MGAAATKTLHEVEFRDIGSNIHVTAEPELPDAGVILDASGKELAPTSGTGWMVKADTKAGEEITLRKGTVWGIGLACALIPMIVVVAAILIGYGREDQSQKERLGVVEMNVKETRDDIKNLNNKFDEMQKILQVQALKDAEKRGYELKAAEGDHGRDK